MPDPVDPRILEALRGLATLHESMIARLARDLVTAGKALGAVQDILLRRKLTTEAEIEQLEAAWGAWLEVERTVGALRDKPHIAAEHRDRVAEILAALERGEAPPVPAPVTP
jgi:hypothetical protein